MGGERCVQVGDVSLCVLEDGVGGHPLMLVHGFTGAKEDFAGHVPRLASQGHHVVAPDLRGHGRSEKPDRETAYGLGTFAGDLVALADALGWQRFVLLGHSMGGMAAQLLALEHPDRLVGLVLMDTLHRAPTGLPPQLVALGAEVVRRGGMALLNELQRSWAVEPPPMSEAALVAQVERAERRLAEHPPDPDGPDGKLLAASSDMWLALSDEMASQPDRLERLRGLVVPTLVLVGELDQPFLGQSRRMAEAIPGAQLVVVPRAGHSPQIDNPGAWSDALTRFLEDKWQTR